MKTRVAIIEDDPELSRLVGGWVREAADLELTGAHPSAEAALKDLPAQRPDVVLTDINLPGMDGIECIRHLKAAMPDAQFLMVTVYQDTERIFNALAAGACGYLLKRSTREQLLDAISEIRAGGSPMSPQIARKVVQSFQAAPAHNPAEGLSARESEILALLSQGFLYKEIAEQMGSSIHTINTHIRRIYEKLHVHSRAQAVAKFWRK
jgi:DNA-binding NarL/FixJ family response regulator